MPASTMRWFQASNICNWRHIISRLSRKLVLRLTSLRKVVSKPWWASLRAGISNDSSRAFKRFASAFAAHWKPLFNVQLSALRKGYKAFQGHKDVKQLLSDLAELQATSDNANARADCSAIPAPPNLTRGDLRLICFDVVSSG